MPGLSGADSSLAAVWQLRHPFRAQMMAAHTTPQQAQER